MTEKSLEGVWFNEHTTSYEGPLLTSRLEYHFRSDNRVEVFRKIFNQPAGQLVGYQVSCYGNYSLEGDSLKLFNLQSYQHDFSNGFAKGYYSPLDQLQFAGPQADLHWKVSFDSTETRVTFHFPPCVDTGDCVDYQVFEKE
jgi:hypothetical protein